MVQRIISFSFVLLCTILVFNIAAIAQDVIVKNDKTEIQVKVLEIDETSIKYKNFDHLDGPTYSIQKRLVFMVIYQNGKRETFTITPALDNTNAAVNRQEPVIETQVPITVAPTPIQTTAVKANEVKKTEFEYAPNRLTVNFSELYNFSMSFMGDLASSSRAADENAPILSYFNWGYTTSVSIYTNDVVDFSQTVWDFGLYGLWYFPINKLNKSENYNTGLFPYVYGGGVLRSIDVSSGEEEYSDWTGDFTLGLGVDWKITKGFGLSLIYDTNYRLGAGINFTF